MIFSLLFFLIGCSYMIKVGLKFESKYSLVWLVAGFVFLLYYIHQTLWFLPGLIPGKILFSIKPEEMIIYKKKTVMLNNVRNVDLKRNTFNLINYIVIEPFEGRKVRIPTYNVIDDDHYLIIFDRHVYPYMTDQAKQVWDRKINLDMLLEDWKYKRGEPFTLK
ncbi:DUF5381 family protein [Bacillus carboniphilus]|uniref:DUF5381 family protein n=1 Tax=Bacillus carboniphilus TaxID=86663 RepID=A0ABY9JY31_9BACI|nr:DUF5381 family protein [Bacillus carboniphilus]WLR44316.1 DUF5381 family protein [Bacillus carboniphilus]